MSRVVVVTGTPTLTLNDGGWANYIAGSGTNRLTFTRTVAAGRNTPALAVTAVTLPAGASITNLAGQAALLTAAAVTLPGPVIIDTTAPAVTERVAHDTGVSATDQITSDPTLTGSGDPNAVVTLTEGNVTLGTTTASATGAWTFLPSGLADGAHTVVARETDAAGNTGTTSLAFTLETTASTVTDVNPALPARHSLPAKH